MPSLELTRGDLILIAIIVVMVVLPSQLTQVGDFLGRLLRGRGP